MVALAPERSTDQRLESLRHANEIRISRARLKKAIKAGGIDPVATLRQPPDYMLSMKVSKFLETVPKLGAVKAARMMSIARVSYGKTVGGLSDRQRGELARLLESR